jgi:uncharacterized cupredoxin-like copper-binding protein
MTSEMAHGEAELPEVQHPLPRIGPREYVGIGVFLTVVTALELWVSYSSLGTVKIPILILLSALKFGTVVAFFMHLRFDNKALTRFFVFGLALAAALLVALISIFWNDTTEHRPASQPFTKVSEAAGGAAAGAKSGAAATTTVKASEKEFAIDVPAQVTAGQVTFDISNTGSVAHNFWIVKTDLAADQLPTAAGQVDTSKLSVVGKTSADIAAGASATVTAQLTPGTYVVFCDVPGHYQLGMHALVTAK